MPSALFRALPAYAYTPAEQLERCPIAELRQRLFEPLVRAGAERDRLEALQQDEDNFRRVIAEYLDRAAVRDGLAALFAEAGELGDIRKLSLHRVEPAQSRRLAAIPDSDSALEVLAAHELKIERSARGRSDQLGEWVDLRLVGPVTGPDGRTEIRAAEVRIYIDLGYWVDCFREVNEIGTRVERALDEHSGGAHAPDLR